MGFPFFLKIWKYEERDESGMPNISVSANSPVGELYKYSYTAVLYSPFVPSLRLLFFSAYHPGAGSFEVMSSEEEVFDVFYEI